MSTDIHLAFDHPEARAAAMASDTPLDRISLRDHVVEVEIGAFQSERGTTQRICFNIVVEVRPHNSPLHDDVDRILSYDTITQAIQFELAAERLNLLETLADQIAERILMEPQAERVFVRIEKLDRGPGALGVEIVRAKENEAPVVADLTSVEEAQFQPILLFLSNKAIASPRLSGWLDEVLATEKPVVVCVGQSATKLPKSAVFGAQRRIDLLSIEQNAWVLAGNDPRCIVMETRTELDWAARNDQLSVWAPSKMVLDAVDGPPTGAIDPIKLTQWFAEELDAEQIIFIDAKVAVKGNVRSAMLELDADRIL